jgi:16S rRNA (uracil1498-N3)-methyltransferase
VHRFYAPAFAEKGDVTLPEDESRHLARVLRLKPGDEIAIFDGRGHEALARVQEISGTQVVVRSVASRQPAPEPKHSLTLAQALLKSDKMDDVIRDAVMLGVASVQPFVSKRAEVPRAALRTGARHDRWNRTAISSVKQCGRAVIPPILETLDFEAVLKRTSGRTCVMLVEPSAVGADDRGLRSIEGTAPADPVIIIGPEGGWEPDEVNAARDAGVSLVTFAGATLRADAAGAAAIAVLRYMWDDF